MNKRILSALFFIFVLVSLVQAQETLEINYRGNPQRTGVYDVEAIDHSPNIAWQESFASIDVDAFVVDDQIFVTATEQRNQGTLYALTTSGEKQWSVPLTGAIMGPMAYGHGLLLVGTSARKLTAIDPKNGETRWTFSQAGRVWSSPLVIDDRVFIASERGIFALDIETGDEIWHNDDCKQSGAPAFSGEMLLFPCWTSLEAIDAETGSTLWSLVVEEGSIYSAAIEGNVLIATGDKSLYAVNLETQTILWTATTGLNWSPATVTADRVFAGNMDGFMYAYDRANGDLLWSLEVGDWATTEPVLIGDGLYFGFGNHFDPAIPHDFYALDAESGAIRWQFEVDGMVINEASAHDNVLYVTTNNGTLYALEEPTDE